MTEPDRGFLDLGVNSLMLTRMAESINTTLSISSITALVLLEHSSLNKLRSYLKIG